MQSISFCKHEDVNIEFKTILGCTKILYKCSDCRMTIREDFYNDVAKNGLCPECQDPLDSSSYGNEYYLYCNCGYFLTSELIRCPLCLSESTIKDSINKSLNICLTCENRFEKIGSNYSQPLDKKSILVYI